MFTGAGFTISFEPSKAAADIRPFSVGTQRVGITLVVLGTYTFINV